ncbi:MAG: response regulator transcription factor [Pseudomonadota bacterium]
MRVLIVEDEPKAAEYIRKALSESGHPADIASDGQEGLVQAQSSHYDVLVVDRMLPYLDGLTLIGQLRKEGVTTPVLILSALSAVDDRVKGLQAGGDDYLSKPFAFSELLARLEALTRRPQPAQTETRLVVADLVLDRLTNKVKRAGQIISLQPREFQLLEFLLKHQGQVVTRTMLLEGVWDYHFDPHTNVVDVHISRLRAKIDKNFDRPLLHTIRGRGYIIDASESDGG